MSDDAPAMSSNRPYLLRALYEWIGDNQMTPHLLVDASREGVQVPVSAVKDGRVVLNVAARAVSQLDLGNREGWKTAMDDHGPAGRGAVGPHATAGRQSTVSQAWLPAPV